MLQKTESREQGYPGVEHILRRIQSEFLEMPGLRLTCAQAQRLFDLDALVCESLLAALVDARFLVETSSGFFVRHTDTVSHPNRRVA